MLMEAKKNLGYFKNAIVCNLKSVLEYKKSFIVQTIFMMVNNGFFLIFWSVVFGVNNNSIQGLEMKDIIYLWSFPTIGYGIVHFFFEGINTINKKLLYGGLDSYMTQPKSVYFNLITSKMDFSAFGDLCYGIILAISVSENIGRFLEIILMGIITATVLLSTMTIVRSLAIWLGDVEEIAGKYEHNFLINFSTYPEAIFGNTIKVIFYTVIPVGYMTYLPVRLLNSFNIKDAIILGIAVIFYLLLAVFVFKKAIKNYESGNAMTMRE